MNAECRMQNAELIEIGVLSLDGTPVLNSEFGDVSLCETRQVRLRTLNSEFGIVGDFPKEKLHLIIGLVE